MNSQTTDEILDAAVHLPEGAVLIIPLVSWDDYECLLEGFAERHLRVSYDEGRLEIVSPLSEHEEFIRFIDRMVFALADMYEVEVEPRGSTTWKKRALRKGAEPDCCYYVRNAKRIIGNRRLDLESDPPPDVIVEIDTTNQSLNKLQIYAAFAVPEVWRYDGKIMHFYTLVRGKYVPAFTSKSFPGLTGEMLAESLEVSKSRGQKAALKVFRGRIQG